MKREDKNELSKRRILDAALREFSSKGYDGASLNSVCAENGISKGNIYYHFKDKDSIYLVCIEECFEKFTAYLEKAWCNMEGNSESCLHGYFDARLKFFMENPMYLGMFIEVALNSPEHLRAEITERRKAFDNFNISVFAEILKGAVLRNGITVLSAAEDFRMYMDFFNMRLREELANASSSEQAIKKYEERCRRQIDIFLYGVLVNKGGNK